MKVNVWKEDNYDIAAPSDCPPYNLICFKKNVLDFIQQETIVIGNYTFVTGKRYNKFGSKKRTSAGYDWFHCRKKDGVLYHGHYEGYLLFTKGDQPVVQEEYTAIYFTLLRLDNEAALFFLNYAGAGRVIIMDNR